MDWRREEVEVAEDRESVRAARREIKAGIGVKYALDEKCEEDNRKSRVQDCILHV